MLHNDLWLSFETPQRSKRTYLGGTLQQTCLILNYQEVEINQEEIE